MGEVSPLNSLYARYRERGVDVLTIYVREPHPGEQYGHHTSFEQKLQFARDCRAQDGIANPLLVDDLEGSVHRAFGMLPNMIYVVDQDGRIAYKAMWTDHAEIEQVLENLLEADALKAEGVRLKTSYSERIQYIPADYAGGVRQRVFDRAGPSAWEDHRNAFRPPAG